MRARRAISLTAGLTTFAIVVGGTGAMAAWTASDQFTVEAATAQMGVAAVGGTGLAGEYSTSTTSFAQEIAITNTGTREAAYTLAAATSNATDANLPAAIAVRAGTTSGSCTTGSTLDDEVTGTLASFLYDSASLTTPLKLAAAGDAGDSVTLCVITTMTSADITTYAGDSLDLTLTPSLVYAAGSAWTATGTAVTAQQSVADASAPLWESTWAGRYYLRSKLQYNGSTLSACNNNQYSKSVGGTSLNFPAGDTCTTGWGHQWRIWETDDPDEFYILQAENSNVSLTTPRWTDNSSDPFFFDFGGNGSMTASWVSREAAGSNEDAQRWRIEERADGYYRLVAVGASETSGVDQCAAIDDSTNFYYPPNGASIPFPIVVEACDDTSDGQGFLAELIGRPLPKAYNAATDPAEWNDSTVVNGLYQAVCAAGGNSGYQSFSWGKSFEYTGELVYRVLIDDLTLVTATTPNQNTTSGGVTLGSGSWPALQLNGSSTALESIYQALDSASQAAWQTGTSVTLLVEQSIAGSEWVPVAWSTVLTVARTSANTFTLGC